MFGTLTKPADFAAVYAQGQKAVSRNFVLFYLPHAESRSPAENPGYAVVASKKTIGNAVRRNKAKRLLRELWRASRLSRTSERGGRFILVARAQILRSKFAEMQSELAGCLKDFGLG